MLNKLLILSVFLCSLLFIGCSHNSVQYSDGIGLETTANPETFTFGLNFRYGKILSTVIRENTEIELAGTGKANGEATSSATSSATSDTSLKVKTGRQITGYFVDALKAGATVDQLEKYLDEEKK